MKEINLESELSFSRDNLENACLTQVSLMCKYTKLYAMAEQLLNAAEEEVKTLRSKLILKVEGDNTLLGEGISKNIQTVEAWYRSRTSYREAVEREQKARYNFTIMQNAMYTLAHRKTMIETLMRAHLGNINSEPDVSATSINHSPSLIRIGKKMKQSQVTQRIKNKLQKGG